jgi:hypothetical protein
MILDVPKEREIVKVCHQNRVYFALDTLLYMTDIPAALLDPHRFLDE